LTLSVGLPASSTSATRVLRDHICALCGLKIRSSTSYSVSRTTVMIFFFTTRNSTLRRGPEPDRMRACKMSPL